MNILESDYINRIFQVEAERDKLLQTLATERDKFGKRETELMARVERLEKALKSIFDGDHIADCYTCYLGDNGYTCYRTYAEEALRDGEQEA